jgi:hypothetical protein
MSEAVLERPLEGDTALRLPNPSIGVGLALVALCAVAVYINTLWNGFAYDDDWIIVRNTRVHQLKDLALIWGTPYWPSFGQELGLYRPLAIFAYALQWAAGNGHPWVFHAVNTGLHTVVSILVFLLLRPMSTQRAALIGGIVFAVHPLHTEAVSNSVGQAELLAAACVLAACVLHAYRDTTKPPWWHLVVLPGLYFTGLLAKEAAITLPALLVLIDVAQRRFAPAPTPRPPDAQAPRRPGRDLLMFTGSYLRSTWLLYFLVAAAAILYLSIRVGVLGSISGMDAAPSLPFLREEHRILNAFRAWPEFVRLLFFPKDLSADYSPAVILPVESLTPMAVLGALVLLGTILLACATFVHPQAGFPAAWFFITVLTVSNLLFPIGVVVAERTLYLPSVAAAATIAFLWQALETRATGRELRVFAGVLLILIGLMGYRTAQRNPTWKDTLTVLNQIVKDHPESYRTAWLMADHYWRQNDIDQSRFYWEAAILLWPRDSQLLAEYANFNIGQRHWSKAVELLERARAMTSWVPLVRELLAYSYVHADRPREALKEADEAVALEGRLGMLLGIKARAYEELDLPNQAIGAWRAGLQHKGAIRWLYHAMLARVLARTGDSATALAAADSAVAAAPDSTAARTTAALRGAIQSGCYSGRALAGCDPLEGWILAPSRQPTHRELQQSSQNATEIGR